MSITFGNGVIEHTSPSSPRSSDGRYIRMGFIRRGSYKEVYAALDVEEGTQVAWYETRSTVGQQAELLLHEIFLLQHLSHPNILHCKTCWVETKRNCHVFITELMSNGTLTEYQKLMPEGRFRTRALARYARQILLALQYLHEREIIHRDVKGSNLFVHGCGGEVRLGDLGVCTMEGVSSDVVGTPEYMAPEMYEGTYNMAVDVWAFGMCVLEMATGKKAYYDCDSVREIHRRVSMGVLPHVAEIPDVAVYSLVMRCLQWDPAARPDATQLLGDPLLVAAEETASSFVPCAPSRRLIVSLNAPTRTPKPELDANKGHEHHVDVENEGEDGGFTDASVWLQAAPAEIRADVLRCAWRRGWLPVWTHTNTSSHASSRTNRRPFNYHRRPSDSPFSFSLPHPHRRCNHHHRRSYQQVYGNSSSGSNVCSELSTPKMTPMQSAECERAPSEGEQYDALLFSGESLHTNKRCGVSD